jgi:hypothetical protein
MAKKVTTKKNSTRTAGIVPTPVVPTPVASTPVRNTPIPKEVSVRREITHDLIAKRAYEIYLSGTGGSADENWARAERELRGW